MTARKAQSAANLAFGALLYSLCAMALIAAWSLQAGASLHRYLVIEAIGLLVIALAFRRFRLELPNMAIIEGTAKHRIWQCVTLAAIGIVLALLALAGSVALFGICAAGINCTPWSRMALCRNNLLASCALVLGGGAGVMLVARLPRDPFVLPLVAWVLWVIACFNLLYLALRNGTGARPASRQHLA